MRAASSSTAGAKRLRGSAGSHPTCARSDEPPPATSTTLCAACNCSIPTRADRVRLMPCSHLSCTFCVLKSHAKRGCKHQKCPVCDCKQPTSSNKYIFADSGESKTLSTTVDDAELKNNTETRFCITHKITKQLHYRALN
jgi:hypothetical protein